jgi:hypothetical protein
MLYSFCNFYPCIAVKNLTAIQKMGKMDHVLNGNSDSGDIRKVLFPHRIRNTRWNCHRDGKPFLENWWRNIYFLTKRRKSNSTNKWFNQGEIPFVNCYNGRSLSLGGTHCRNQNVWSNLNKYSKESTKLLWWKMREIIVEILLVGRTQNFASSDI